MGYLNSMIFSYIWSSLGPESAATLVHVQCIQLMTLAYSQKYLFLDIIGLLPEILDETFDGYVHANFHTNMVLHWPTGAGI